MDLKNLPEDVFVRLFGMHLLVLRSYKILRHFRVPAHQTVQKRWWQRLWWWVRWWMWWWMWRWVRRWVRWQLMRWWKLTYDMINAQRVEISGNLVEWGNMACRRGLTVPKAAVEWARKVDVHHQLGSSIHDRTRFVCKVFLIKCTTMTLQANGRRKTCGSRRENPPDNMLFRLVAC